MEMIKYSYKQIRHILEWQGYKMELLWNYKQRVSRYNILDHEGNVVFKGVTLNWLRWRFTNLGYPSDFDPVPSRIRKKTIIRYDKENDMMYFDKE